ncbi:type II toxin-antitoxin system PemK/MazF family toxin [Baaleninema sp.]|uniref:type II toxin-antitoxin system PemK/MazF family toxin n=1 Tax=Baaleninema sp. TaxID=3101197 RepID=UPI003D02C029
MPSTTTYKFGDIVLVQFPFTDLSTTKKRPSIVVSSQAYNRNRSDIVVMAVSSRVRIPARFGEVIIQDWQRSGLLKPSAIKPVFSTLNLQVVLKYIGSLQASDRESILRVLPQILGDSN